MTTTHQLRPYQQEGVKKLIELTARRHAALLADRIVMVSYSSITPLEISPQLTM